MAKTDLDVHVNYPIDVPRVLRRSAMFYRQAALRGSLEQDFEKEGKWRAVALVVEQAAAIIEQLDPQFVSGRGRLLAWGLETPLSISRPRLGGR